jgi:hypothetical protein
VQTDIPEGFPNLKKEARRQQKTKKRKAANKCKGFSSRTKTRRGAKKEDASVEEIKEQKLGFSNPHKSTKLMVLTVE